MNNSNGPTELAEVMSTPQVVDNSALYLITKAEIDIQISTAKAFPRSLTEFLRRAESMATLNEDIAAACSYSLPRGGKALDGKSVRLAEIICAAYGHIRSGARVIANDGKTITAQGICHDLETNNCVTVEVKRSILQNEYKDGQKTGRKVPMNEDMQVVTGNAACAIAYRNAVFKVVPSALTDTIYEKAKEVARGTAETLVTRRDKALTYFRGLGVKDGQICEALGIKKVEDVDLDKLATLTGMKAAIKNGEATVQSLFEPAETKVPVNKEHERISLLISDAKTLEELEKHYENVPDELMETYLSKKAALSNVKAQPEIFAEEKKESTTSKKK